MLQFVQRAAGVQMAEWSMSHYHSWCNQKKPTITSVTAVQPHTNTEKNDWAQPLTSWTVGWQWQWWWWGPRPKLDPSPTTSPAAPSREPLLSWPGLGLSRDWLKMSSGREKNKGKVQVHENKVTLELYATFFFLSICTWPSEGEI